MYYLTAFPDKPHVWPDAGPTVAAGLITQVPAKAQRYFKLFVALVSLTQAFAFGLTVLAEAWVIAEL